ncbi:uncharacterized protein LOC107043670 [Diachasma alloeum]|uniref:uncharacterized protein LOC107043670 n=1 Tax=Diachasma alloeum TaxID=454923 RepID=UPI00073842FE|nr:uncharacterized protein LOC107043670 [Diachasma alloeum]
MGTATGELTDTQKIQKNKLDFKVKSLNDIYQELLQSAENIGGLTVKELDGQEKIIEGEWNELLIIQDKLSETLLPTHQHIIQSTYERASTLKKTCLTLIYQLKGIIKKRESTKGKQFSDLFQSLVIKDDSIPPLQKLVHLREALKGQAANLIDTFTVTDENYEAWQKLITKATVENLNAHAATALETRVQLITITGLSKESVSEQMIVHLLTKSLDAETLRAWELKLGDSKDFPTLEEFTGVVESCARGINAGAKLTTEPLTSPVKKRGASQRQRNAHLAVTQQGEPEEPTRLLPKEHCAYCKGPHFIANCQRFVDLSPIKRNEFVVSRRLCFNCLGPHLFAKGRSTKTSFSCKCRHHTLIHGGSTYTNGREAEQAALVDPPRGENPQTFQPGTSWAESSRASPTRLITNQAISTSKSPVIKEETTKQPIIEQSSHHSAADQQYVLLATAQVRGQSPKGFLLKARALIDQGSELSFISEELVHQLQLLRTSSKIELIGIGETNSGHTRGAVSVLLQAVDGSKQVKINAHILKKLTVKLPSFSCSPTWIDPPQGLQLADPVYLKPGPIDTIIGADNYGRIIKSRVILTGPIECSGCLPRVSLSAVKESSNEQLQELLQRFWHQEELPKNSNSSAELLPDEIECEKFFKSTHTRDDTGHYIVRLPLRTSPTALGGSKFKASRQLLSAARRLQTDESYSQLYREFVNEYEALGHMRKAPEGPEPVTAYYLPHHGVLREDALTTKLRVVFNGSSPRSSGLSLNDILHPGEKLQVITMNVLTWLRKHRIVFGTDIVKMFRQIRVHQDNWDLQRILWINENQQQIT